MSLLEVEDLAVAYGPATALENVSFTVAAGEVVTLIGPNGAGKTSTLRAVSGLMLSNMAARGRVRFDGQPILGLAAHKVARLGLVHAPEGRRVFPAASVEDNILLGGYRLRRSESKADRHERMEELLRRFPVLGQRRRQFAGLLSGGEQQQLAIARALMAQPRLLVLDEPSLGLAPRLVAEMFRIIKELAAAGTTILLVEQMARQAMAVADRVYVLEGGRVVHEGAAADVAAAPHVRAAYLGIAAAS
jgi:branched-chain amino acid transport system ATP-binding protein